MAKLSIAEAMKPHGNPPGPGKSEAEESEADESAGESEAYVADLQSAIDSGDGQALYDTICSIMAAKK